ncbi:MAG: hypothetical protein ACERKN_22120 [Velocimicrobium sp.]
MREEVMLRSVLFGGYSRDDVTRYIDELVKENNEIVKEYQIQLEELKNQNTVLTLHEKEVAANLQQEEEKFYEGHKQYNDTTMYPPNYEKYSQIVESIHYVDTLHPEVEIFAKLEKMQKKIVKEKNKNSNLKAELKAANKLINHLIKK